MHQSSNDKRPHIVILGGGFAGVYAYRAIEKYVKPDVDVKVTLINKDDRFLFVPLIHEVATGNLLPESLIQPLRKIAPECDFLEGEVVSIDADKKTVRIRNKEAYKKAAQIGPDKEPTLEISYDYLITALGAETYFKDVPGAKEYSFPLYGMGDAKRIKNQIIESFERAQFLKDDMEIKKVLTFVVIGGGGTGVEIAAEMADFIRKEVRISFGEKLYKNSRVLLIHSGERLLQDVSPWFSKNVLKSFKKMNIEVHFNKRVTEVKKDGVLIGENFLPAHTVIWGAGVKAREVETRSKKQIERDMKTRRMKVNSYLQTENYPEIFAVGDQAWICNKEKGVPYPMRAQFAVREGITAAKNIGRLLKDKPLQEFHWQDMGFIVSLGGKHALAEIYKLHLTGFFAWVFYRGAYLSKIVGLKAKLRTLLEWNLNLFLDRDVSKL